ncbi:MAG: F0F1 ATP synthase subunit A [Chloroflexota bacterium]
MSKRGCLGFSLPVAIGIILLLLFLFLVAFAAGALGPKLLGLFGLGWISESLSFLSVPQPKPELPAEVVLEVFHFPITNSILGAWLTIIFLVGFSFAVTRRMKLVPGRLQALFELLVGGLYNFCVSVAGEKNGRCFFPVVATIFLFVAFNGWLSLLPGFGSIEVVNPEGHHVHLLRGANTDINLPLALALMSFFFVWYFGLRDLGIRYVSQFINVGPLLRGFDRIFKGKIKEGFSGLFLGFINFFVGLLELLSQFIRILSFTLRLFGNMTAGEILVLVVAFLIPFVVSPIFYGLELLVGFVQALIFGGLTLVFLTLATAGHAEETHREEAH